MPPRRPSRPARAPRGPRTSADRTAARGARPARPSRPTPSAAAAAHAAAAPGGQAGVAVEIAVAPGLADLALHELRELARRTRLQLSDVAVDDDALRLVWPGDAAALHGLRTVQSVARRWRFEAPRPKALLDNTVLKTLRAGLTALRREEPFHGLRLSAAGRDSAVMQRLATTLAEAVGLPRDDDDGDLVVRVRPAPEGGWEVLARTTPRPLTVRPWRVCDRPGGIDAALAAALVRLAGVQAGDRVANPMLGSGTLLIERALAGAASALHGGDIDPDAVACARDNATAAGVVDRVELRVGDALDVPERPAQRYELQLVDPPWGDAVGHRSAVAHRDGAAAAMVALLRATARSAVVGGRLVLVTHEVRLAERLLGEQPWWAPKHARRVWQGGHRPLCVVLERLPGAA